MKEIEPLKEIAENRRLQTSFEKTEYMNVDAKNPTWIMRTEYDDIKRANKFNNVGEILTLNINGKAAIEDRPRKMELAFRLCEETYKFKSLSY